MAKKINEEEIDEDFIIASMNTANPIMPTRASNEAAENSVQIETVPLTQERRDEPTKEDVIRKKKPKGDYESLFIKEVSIIGRKEKTTYLRSAFYRKIQGVLLCYDNPNLSIFGYIDAVLAYHFESFEQDIKDIRKKYEES